MELRYAGVCKVCGESLPKGTHAYWDAAARTVTCHALACCEADGLTRQEWHGSPLSGSMVPARTEKRYGRSAPRVITSTFNSGESVSVNARGRCEDAPCCGCCS